MSESGQPERLKTPVLRYRLEPSCHASTNRPHSQRSQRSGCRERRRRRYRLPERAPGKRAVPSGILPRPCRSTCPSTASRLSLDGDCVDLYREPEGAKSSGSSEQTGERSSSLLQNRPTLVVVSHFAEMLAVILKVRSCSPARCTISMLRMIIISPSGPSTDKGAHFNAADVPYFSCRPAS